MISVVAQMSALIICGVLWSLLRPAGLAPAQSRLVLTNLVYYLLLPALVLLVLWQADLGIKSLAIAVVAASSVLSGLALGWLVYRSLGNSRAMIGALLLAAAFPNATYLGLPVLEATFGSWARSIAVQYDLFACTPLLLTLGVVVARRFGSQSEQAEENMLTTLATVPALWAALVAIALNVAKVPLPLMLSEWLDRLAGAVVPLMLIALGMGLSWRRRPAGDYLLLLPVLIIQLAVMPVLVFAAGSVLGLDGDVLTAVMLEGAMPCMVLGIVFCDRFNLDSNLYAMAVTTSTLASLVSLPLWFGFAGTLPVSGR